MRSHLLLVIALVVQGGCLVDVDFDGTSFACTSGECPDGYACVAERCVLPTDAGGGASDASESSADAGSDQADAAVQLATCDEQFSAAPGYVLCVEAADTCEFFHLVDVAVPCDQVCATYGSTCVTTYNSTPGTECTREEEGPCTTARGSQLCVCAR
jgi:hypothetical protein